MKPIRDMDTIQVEITNACQNQCSNCTRLCGHHPHPYFMPIEMVVKAIESLKGYPYMTGIMGGEPLLHPEFEEICVYLRKTLEPWQLGLWTTLPVGKEHYAETICKTFGHLFPNDHTRNDVLHFPILVESEKLPIDVDDRWYLIDACFAQNKWSASINPKGAFFCEIAASLAMVLPGEGRPVEPYWWAKAPIDYAKQMKKYCGKCGLAMPLKKRYSVEVIDDISEGWLNRLKNSPKLKAGKYLKFDGVLMEDPRPMATYKNPMYRKKIVDRYDMLALPNSMNYLTPVMKKRRKHNATLPVV
jgi:hypothetical protein